MRIPIVVLTILLVVACGGGGDVPSPPDTAAPAAVPGTLEAAALRDSALATITTLLDKPESAMFDSVVVVQPPREGDRLPAMAVCGRINGRPGIGGSTVPKRFVFQNKWALFVEDGSNEAEFAALWARECGGSGGVVVVEG